MKRVKTVQITMASPDTVFGWSKGEVKKPETINYRTFKPERDGLFCEKIFGPTKDYECSCGKYKGKKYEGTVCERCNVRVEPKSSRRKNMGHIQLAAPVVHLWFLKSTPSILSNLLNMTSKNLENIIYFGSRRIIEKIFVIVDRKDTAFDNGDTLYETEHDIYSLFWDFEAEPAVTVKNPTGPVKSEIQGMVSITEEETHTGKTLYWVTVTDKVSEPYAVHKNRTINFKGGQEIQAGQQLVSEQTIPAIYSPIDG
ncbi:MAG TPA: DNA-directed RNA polymerase subunit beta', partial [Thermotogota bacterium]|nr:DNA-directed RNA polymerase subunit beta' [Thermotogota bacterium]